MKLPDIIQRELDTLKTSYKIVRGGKHYKLCVNGKFCGIIQSGGGSNTNRGALNIRAQIRRAAIITEKTE